MKHSNQILGYHIDGTSVEMYPVDAHSAVSRFPNEWSLTSWEERKKAKRHAEEEARLLREAQERDAAEAKANKAADMQALERGKKT